MFANNKNYCIILPVIINKHQFLNIDFCNKFTFIYIISLINYKIKIKKLYPKTRVAIVEIKEIHSEWQFL